MKAPVLAALLTLVAGTALPQPAGETLAAREQARLCERLDEYSVGFATTESGIELRLLRKLFTEEEAAMYLNLTGDLQTAEQVCGENC